jgi:hypothetical protein
LTAENLAAVEPVEDLSPEIEVERLDWTKEIEAVN